MKATVHLWKIGTLLLLLTLSAGCGSESRELYPVHGVITLDGKPLTTGTVVTSLDEGRGARGEIDSEGNFTLETANLGPGAVPGLHRVAVTAYSSKDLTDPENVGTLLVPERYAFPASSGLSLQVEPKPDNVAVLELTTKK